MTIDPRRPVPSPSPAIPSGDGMDRRIARPKWRNRRLFWLAGALVLMVLAAIVIPRIPPPGSLTVKGVGP